MKQCEKCGHQIIEGTAFCTNCGAAVANTAQSPVGPTAGTAIPSAPSAPINQFAGPSTTGASNMSVQPAPMQPFGSISSQTPLANTSQKQSNGKIIAMAAACVVCLAVGVTGIVMALNSNNNNNGSGGSNNTATPSSNESPSNNSGSTYVPTTSNYDAKISYAGYEFSVPASYDYEIYEDETGTECLSISDLPDVYLADICYYNDYTYTTLVNSLDKIVDGLKTTYGDSVVMGTEIVDGKDYIYFDIGAIEGTNLTVLMSAADLYYFETAVITNIGDSGVNYIGNIAEVLNTAQKKNGASRSLGSNNGFNAVKTPKLGNTMGN